MATQEATPTAEVVGNAFVEQYYHILHQSPGLVHRFYHESSLLSRPDPNGLMTTVTTMQAINEKILSLNYEDYTAEIQTADAQESYQKGVIVLVTGCLTGKDNVKKKFSQTFFLAPQDKGYFVLNDVFRFLGFDEPLPNNSVPVSVVREDAAGATLAPEPGPSETNQIVDHGASYEGEAVNNGAEVSYSADNEAGSVAVEEAVKPSTETTESEILASTDAATVSAEDAPKQSYASIVRVMKGNMTSGPAHTATAKARTAPTNSKQQPVSTAKPVSEPEASVSAGDTAPASDNVHEEAEGYSIHVRNLPFDATPEQLDEVFKKFGPIKRDGIQVRSNKQGFCFGFVEFESSSSMQSALQASPINVADHQAIIEEKRTNTKVTSSGGGGGRGRYSSGRSGYRSDSFKNRGNFGGRGYGRNEYRNQGDYSGRGRGSGGQFGDDNYWGNQNAHRRGGRQGGGKSSNTNPTST